MGGYQSDSSVSNYWNTRGEFDVEDNQPFPAGVRNDVWIITGGGTVGGMISVSKGDILFCTNDNPGGNFIQGWIVIPHKFPEP